MRILKTSSILPSLLLALCLLGAPSQLYAFPWSASTSGAASSCEDFAQRQVQLADDLLQRSNHTRALKVLNSTAENCDIGMVREKIVEVLDDWYGQIRGQGTSALRDFLNVLSNQPHLSSGQKTQLRNRAGGYVRTLIEQDYDKESYQAAYSLCRSFSDFVDKRFEAEYYCGTSALELGAEAAAVNSYSWLLDNWKSNQSLASWKGLASTLEDLYFLNGRFQAAYALARQRARRHPSPESVLASVISARGQFTAPLLRAGKLFYETDPSQSAVSHVRRDLKRVNFPKYVNSLYLLNSEGSVKRGLYGEEANEPSMSLLETAQGTISLLQSTGDSNLAWLVSPFGDQFLVLEFGVATTPEESVRLETVYESVESDEEWKKLYDLEFTETVPATGSAVGTFLSSSSIANEDLDPFDAIFEASSLLSYYCLQNNRGTVQAKYNYDRESLRYEESTWKETSNTRSLYHHELAYGDQSVREVVWPIYIQKERNGVIRIGLIQN
jgi:hypothetical protein